MNDLRDAQEALQFIPANDYDTWVRVGAALHSEFGEEGREPFFGWSASADNFKERDAAAKWNACKKMSRVTIGTIFYHARQNGYVPNGVNRNIDPAILAVKRAEREAAIAKAEAEERDRHERKRLDADAIWNAAQPATSELAYLQRKGVKAYGLRQTSWTIRYQDTNDTWQNATVAGCALVPMMDAYGKLWGVQALLPNSDARIGRDKDYLSGCKKQGCYFLIGTPSERLYIVEGYATGATVHHATGHAVVVAFDAGNIPHVAKALRAKYPALEIVIASDNDQWTKGNPGKTKATEAAQAINAKLSIPEFSNTEGQPTDYNDMQALSGIEEVRRQLAISSISNVSKPRPLQRPMTKAQPFPLDSLPTILKDAAAKMIEAIQAPPALCGNSLLAAASLATQAHADVVIDGRRSPLSEFYLSVGESGERKSAVDRIALWPHRQYEDALREQYGIDFLRWEGEEEAYETSKKQATAGKKDYASKKAEIAKLSADRPVKPLGPTFIMEEPTYEAIQKELAHGQPSIGLFSDEGGRFIGGHGMNKDNMLKMATGLSGLWDAKPVSRARASDGSSLLVGRRFSCHLMMQPEVSRLMLSDSLLNSQGLLSRCLVTFPDSTVGTRLYREIDISASPELRAYSGRMLDILRAEKPLREGKQNELNTRLLPLDAAAKRLWIKFHDAIEQQVSPDGELASIRGIASKAAEHAARLAGTLTLVDDFKANSVPLKWMQAGIELMQHYLSEALRLFDAGVADPKLTNAQKLVDWLKPRKGETVSTVEIYQTGPNSVRTASVARELLAILKEHGYVEQDAAGVMYDGAARKEAWRVL